ncbi:MAG: hypothetical protein KDD35_01870, partial [Bdellovibrionales bacterium]|nr:hypothetical protein [Bdellovibrionales bacterium]
MNVLNEIYPSHLDSKSSHDIRSVTKIVTALSLGIAIDLGYVESADNEVVHYLVPSQIKLLKSREIKGLSFKSLLSMTSGFNWYE